MKKVKFVFGIHNHQPVGNFDFVFEDAYQKSYLPFLQILERHPKIRIALHFTGILLDWLEAHHPELLDLVKKMTARGQLEMMSGAYYEPIISVIPERDRQGQINKLTQRVNELFGYRAGGMWLAERIWEPTLPTTLQQAGMRYTVIDDTHFKYAGLTDEELDGYYLTEDLGNTVHLFPIAKMLRYTIPFQEPQATIDFLRENATEDGRNVMVFADDGEKFGVWPDTYQHVYENGWLERFFSVLEENLDWIEMVHFDEALKMVPPKGKIYLPTASYAEMMHWSLFSKTFHWYEEFEHIVQEQGLEEKYGLFVRGGFWRNFMSKYPEVNNMHKKMLRVSNKLWSLPEKQRKKVAKAIDAVWAAQCNCPYWHGVFGGVYLSHIRFAIYQHLIRAENILHETVPQKYPLLEISDFDVDGRDEVLTENAVHNAYFKPDKGAVLFEYDFKAAEKNLLDTMTRREEGYHNKLKSATVVGQNNASQNDDHAASIHDLVLAKEAGLEEYLNYDWYERNSFVDHFLGQDVTPEMFAKAKFSEEGDFVDQPYELTRHTSGAKGARLHFKREGNIWRKTGPLPLSVNKTFDISADEAQIRANYKLSNFSGEAVDLIFAVEFNFGLQAGHADDRFYYEEQGRLNNAYLDSAGILSGRRFIGLKDEYMKMDIQLKANQTADIWRMPVETISLSEGGFERVYQNSVVLFVWKIHLESEWQVTLVQRVDTL